MIRFCSRLMLICLFVLLLATGCTTTPSLVYPSGSQHDLPQWEWTFAAEGKTTTPATLLDGTICFATTRGLYAVDRRTGEGKWTFTPAYRISCLAISSGIVYVGSDIGHLSAVDGKTGDEIWAIRKEGSWWQGRQSVFINGFAVSDDNFYFGDRRGFFYAVDTKTGEKRWESRITYELDTSKPFPGLFLRRNYLMSDSTTSPMYYDSVVVSEQRVYFVSDDGYLYASEKETGRQLWSYHIESEMSAPPAVSGDTVYCGGWDGKLYALDSETGRQLWTTSLIAGNAVYSSFQRYRQTEHGIAVSRSGVVKSSPVVAGGTVYFGSDDGRLYAVDSSTGHEKWTFQTKGGDYFTTDDPGRDRLCGEPGWPLLCA